MENFMVEELDSPAFPVPPKCEPETWGLSKFEYVSAMILAGMMANDSAWGANRHVLAEDAAKTAAALLETVGKFDFSQT